MMCRVQQKNQTLSTPVKPFSILFSLLILFFLSAYSMAPYGYSIGDTVKDFRLINTDGKMVSLADFKKAKGFIVIFSCNHCPYSIIYQQRMLALDKKYKPLGFPVIDISADDPAVLYPKAIVGFANGAVNSLSFDSTASAPLDSYEYMVKQASEEHYTFPYLYDETQMVARAFGAERTPEAYVLMRRGKNLKLCYKGAIDDNSDDSSAVKQHYVEDAVNALLNDKPITITQTKAIGCRIAWKK